MYVLWFYWQIINFKYSDKKNLKICMWNSQILKLVLKESTILLYILRQMICKITHSLDCLWSIIGWLCVWLTYLRMEFGHKQWNDSILFQWRTFTSLTKKNASYDKCSLDPTPDVQICPAVDNCLFNFYNVSVMHNSSMDFRRHWCVESTLSYYQLYIIQNVKCFVLHHLVLLFVTQVLIRSLLADQTNPLWTCATL